MASDLELTRTEALFVSALRCAIHGEKLQGPELKDSEIFSLRRLAVQQGVLPMIAQAIVPEGELSTAMKALYGTARKTTVSQAAHTAEFLLLLDALRSEGLQPLVLKGIVCRSLYPYPEQRPSIDEDLMVPAADFGKYHAALLKLGFSAVDPFSVTEDPDEVSYQDESRGLYLEVHVRLFASGSASYGDLNVLFEHAAERAEELRIYGSELRTFAPTDHLLFLLCHAYKHILHGGVGLRQICDLCLFASHWAEEIDWEKLSQICREKSMSCLAAAFFHIGEQYLGIACPDAFSGEEPETLPLLLDCLRGGLYGADDADRLHSSTLTLEAVAAQKQGRNRLGVLHSVFLPVSYMETRFPYLRKMPWLLPVAWVQRVWIYLTRDRATVSGTLQQGKERMELLRKYNILS